MTTDGGREMRALDCKHPAHEDIHFTASNDDELVEKVEQHIREYHPDMTEDDARTTVSQGAYDE
jgi:predicted small metal-binding protein